MPRRRIISGLIILTIATGLAWAANEFYFVSLSVWLGGPAASGDMGAGTYSFTYWRSGAIEPFRLPVLVAQTLTPELWRSCRRDYDTAHFRRFGVAIDNDEFAATVRIDAAWPLASSAMLLAFIWRRRTSTKGLTAFPVEATVGDAAV